MPGRARRETLSWDTGGIMGVPRRTSKSAGAQAAAKMPRVVAYGMVGMAKGRGEEASARTQAILLEL